MFMSIYKGLEDGIVQCIDRVLNYLRSDRISSNIIGFNLFGDTTKEFDVIAEDILTSCIVDQLSDVIIVGEERGVRIYGSGKWIAIIDPVDGSNNFDADIPWSSISIAIARKENGSSTLRNVVFAVVAEVFRNRMYIYRDGYVDIKGGKISRKEYPKPILLGYFESPESYKPIEKYISIRGKIALRSLGSAALDIVYVGLGAAEGFIDMRSKLRNIDVAAALKIATTLGAETYICDFNDVNKIPLEKPVKIRCIIVGYNSTYLSKLLEASL